MANRYLQFEISLVDIEPRIWRRFLLRDTATFSDLHLAIQDAGPWADDHLYQFLSAKRRGDVIACAEEGGLGDAPVAKDVRLASVVGRKNQRCWYNYDFGDDWFVEVRYLGQVESEERFRRRLLDGARAFPLEDCGGVWGYYRCEALVEKAPQPEAGTDEQDEEGHEDVELREWIGDWDPDCFDLAARKARFDA
jgi:hypothetical protein